MSKRIHTVAYSALTILAISGSAWSNEIASRVSAVSIGDAGRNIMRTADGGMVAAFSTTASDRSSLIFSRSLDNGVSWKNVALEGVAGAVMQTAIDSNFQGSYIAFTENVNGRMVGRIAFVNASLCLGAGCPRSSSCSATRSIVMPPTRRGPTATAPPNMSAKSSPADDDDPVKR
jgi:hypothetical protein